MHATVYSDTPLNQEYQTAFAQHPPSSISTCATTLASVPSLPNCQICTNPAALSVNATNSSLKVLGATELAVPPLLVVAFRKSWDVMAPLLASENAEM
jgi:hypothetical protein